MSKNSRKFRNLKRKGWHVVQLARTNLYKSEHIPLWGDIYHYRDICKWCETTFPIDSWKSRILLNNFSQHKRLNTKEFLFKYEKDRTLFLLRWAE